MWVNENSLGKNGDSRGEGSGARRLLRPLSPAILAAMIIAAAGFPQGSAAAGSDTGREASRALDTAAAEISISEVNENPSQYLGKTVTLEGELKEVISPTAIRIGKGGFLGMGGEEILILGTGAFPPEVSERTEDLTLQVTGSVRQFNRVEIEGDMLIDLDDELFTVYEGRPILVARSIAMAGREEGERVGSAAGEEGEGVGMAPGGTAGGAGMDTGADLARIVENTQEFFGDTVTVTGYVAKIVDSSAFSLSPAPGADGEAILVVGNPGQMSDLAAGKEVSVKGLVGSFDRRQYESQLGVDLDDALFGEWDKDPSILAMSIRPVEDPTAQGPGERGRGGSGDPEAETMEADTASGSPR